MEKREKRDRGANWNHAHTMALAELKREASLNNEHGLLVWERITQTLSSRFPDQIRTGDQCRRRWDTLVKVYNHIEDYCVQTGAQGHRELDQGELASMELATAYHQDWYDIVEQVCCQRKRKESCASDMSFAKRSKGSSNGSQYFEFPRRPDSLGSASISKSVTHYEQSTPESTTTYAQPVPSSPSLEVDKLNPGEEVVRLQNGNDVFVLEATQLWPHGHVSHKVYQETQTLVANVLPRTFQAENEAQLKEPLQDDLWALLDDPPFETSAEIQQPDTESQFTGGALYLHVESVGLGAQSKEIFQDRVRDDSLETANMSRSPSAMKASDNWNTWNFGKVLYTRNASVASSSSSGVTLFSEPPLLSSAIMTASASPSSRSTDSTVSRQSRRWSLKVIVSNVLHCCHACGRKKESIEDMEVESKQAARLKVKVREKALMSRKENVPAIINAASPTSAARGDKSLQMDAHRASRQAAADKKEEETRSRKAERQQLGCTSSSTCVPIGKMCAKLSWKLFPAFHCQSSN